MPVWLRAIVGRLEAGLLFDLANDAAWDIERAVFDVSGVRRAGWEIDPSRVGRVFAHHTEHEGAVGGTQRTHAEAIENGLVGKAPVAPGEEARKIGLEIVCREITIREHGIAPEQHPAIPNLRPLALLLRK